MLEVLPTQVSPPPKQINTGSLKEKVSPTSLTLPSCHHRLELCYLWYRSADHLCAHKCLEVQLQAISMGLGVLFSFFFFSPPSGHDQDLHNMVWVEEYCSSLRPCCFFWHQWYLTKIHQHYPHAYPNCVSLCMHACACIIFWLCASLSLCQSQRDD